MTFRETVAHVKAKRTRKAIAKLYRRNPDKALAHVNAKLDEASRREELLAQSRYSLEV